MKKLSLILCVCTALNASSGFSLIAEQVSPPLPIIDMSEDMRKVEGITDTPQVIATPYAFSLTHPGRVRIFCGLESQLPLAREMPFSSIEQVTKFIKNLFTLYSNNELQKVLTLCQNSFVMYESVSAQVIEQFWFQNIELQISCLRELNIQAYDKSKSSEYSITLIENFKKYLVYYAPDYMPTYETEAHLYCLDFLSMNIYGNDLCSRDLTQEKIVDYLSLSIAFGESALQRMKELSALQKRINDENLNKTINFAEKKFQTNYIENFLLNANISLYKRKWDHKKREQNNNYLNKIKSIYNRLVSSNQLFDQNVEVMTMIQNWTRMKEAEKIPGRKGKAEYLKIRTKALEHAVISNKNNPREYIAQGDRLFSSIQLYWTKKKRNLNSSKELLNEIIQFEDMLYARSQEGSNEEVENPANQLENKIITAYRNYLNLEISRSMHAVFSEHALIFLEQGDIKGAVSRINAFKLVCNERGEQFTKLTRYLCALASSLQGNFDELIALENENMQNAAQQKSQKKQKKTRGEIVEKINEQTTMRAKEVQQEEERQAIASALQEQKMEQRRMNRMHAVREQNSFSDMTMSAQSPLDAKLEKLARHEAAEAKRKSKNKEELSEDRKMTSSELEMHQNTQNEETSPRDSLLEFQAEGAIHLQNLCNIKSKKALKVEEEILANAWKFEREDLIAYYVAMGCEQRAGKGSHSIVTLPKTISFYKDEELITMLSDFGGALTLPQWDDYVPHYLRGQILNAREKLIKIHTSTSSVGEMKGEN